MKISDVKIRKTFDDGTLKAIVSVTFDNSFTVHDIKIVYVNSKYIIVMPNKKLSSGRLSDIAHPINSEFRTELEETIIHIYREHLENF